MNKHKIIYLDQNYISNIAKAQIGEIKNAAQTDFWQSLFKDLKKAVLADKIACPESDFHGIEAMFDNRIEKDIINVVDELSWGLEFRSWGNILTSQIEEAAYSYLGKQPDKKESWPIAFKSNPRAQVRSRMKYIGGNLSRLNVRLFLPSEVADKDRQSKLDFNDKAQELAKQYSEKPLDWPELVLQSKRSTMDGFLGGIARESIGKLLADTSTESNIKGISKFKEWMLLLTRLQEIGIDTTSPTVMDFLESETLLNIPFVDVFSSIWAAIAECYVQGRNVRAGDFYDAPILAVAIPYCDIVTTDKFMKEILINRLSFDKKYDIRIFSANEIDKSDFQNLISGMINS